MVYRGVQMCTSVLIALLALCSVHTSRAAQESGVQRQIVAAYLPNYRLGGVNWAHMTKYATDVIMFSIEIGETGLFRNHVSEEDIQKAKEQAGQGTNLLISVGGGGRSQGFSRVTRDARQRKELIRSLVKFCERNGLQGVDLDWERPSTRDEGKQYVALLREARKYFTKASLILTVALHPNQNLGKSGYAAVDRVHLMSYDAVTQHERRHATPRDAARHTRFLIEKGCPPEKIVLGIPAYARRMSKPQEVQTYREIREKLSPDPSADKAKGFYYNGPKTVFRKSKWAAKEGLGGVFLWEAGQDTTDRYSLLKQMSRALVGAQTAEAREKTEL